MNGRLKFTFTILRYVHDVATGEFVNVGIVLHGAAGNFLGARMLHRTRRISQFFPGVSGESIKRTIGYVESAINSLGRQLSKDHSQSLFKDASAFTFATGVLREDDSALQWAPLGSGVTANFAQTLDRLFGRYVTRYEENRVRQTRTDDQIWRGFSNALQERDLLSHVEEHELVSAVDRVCFKHAMKNGQWHLFEPLSFDLMDGEWIRNKARQLLGQMTAFVESGDSFELYMLIGEPSRPGVQKDYAAARRYLDRMPVPSRTYTEQEVGSFALHMGQVMVAH